MPPIIRLAFPIGELTKSTAAFVSSVKPLIAGITAGTNNSPTALDKSSEAFDKSLNTCVGSFATNSFNDAAPSDRDWETISSCCYTSD